MNYMLLLMGAVMAAQQLHSANQTVDNHQWQSFKMEHNKNYEAKKEEDLRKIVFSYNKYLIDEHNKNKAAEAGFQLGYNHLMDRSKLEIEKLNGFKGHSNLLKAQNDLKSADFLAKILDDKTDLPAEVDWRKVPGRVTRVKDQGLTCGSCWSFAATGVLEGQEAVRRPKMLGANGGEPVELSEQNLIDCTTVDKGCGGGLPWDAMAQVHKEGGIDTESSYPYLGRQSTCRFNKSSAVFSDAGYAMLPSGDENKLMKVVARYGPVAVGIDASTNEFHFYKKGVFYNEECGNQPLDLSHAVLVVGYGTDEQYGDYWIVKNSWGPRYGSDGYILMARNRDNNCGIATAASIPTF